MKQQEIRNIYTQKVTELLNQGYTIFPDTMSGHQGEIAHIDLAKGSEIIRVLLSQGLSWSTLDGGFHGDVVTLTIGRAAADTRIGDRWDGIIWNNRLDVSYEIEWAEIKRRGEGWYTTLEEANRIQEIRNARHKARTKKNDTLFSSGIELGTAYKSTALSWLRKQPKMKTCKLSDIEKMYKITIGNKRRYEIKAKGHTFTLR
ncbi:MAG: hypothetical protein J6Y20_07510 [Lachnospiraceae bacterium]|nr:hypothetical protein [Lachnospiraceae bacterium]